MDVTRQSAVPDQGWTQHYDVLQELGDCLAAVEIAKSCRLGAAEADRRETPAVIDRRDPRVNWAVAFGLSLL